MKIAVLIIIVLTAIAIGLDLSPTVEYQRMSVPEDVYVGKICDCDCIASARPWYSTFNYWYWLWVICAPLLVLTGKPESSQWLRISRIIISIGLCYVFMCLAMDLSFAISDDLFVVHADKIAEQKTWDMPQCGSSSDTARGLIVIFAVLYAPAYTGFWEIIWQFYHRKFSKKAIEDVYSNFLSGILMGLGAAAAVLVLVILVSAILFGNGILK